jgi:hypothetical protein
MNSENAAPEAKGAVWPRGLVVSIFLAGVLLLALAIVPLTAFVIDILWIKYGSAPNVEVLLIDPNEAQKEQQETAKW